MEHFTPLASLIGGMLIGLSASMLLLFNGKIAGISGIIAGILSPAKNDTLWRIVFVAGLLVGFGTRLGNGCTSGHGVCGLSRFSQRSLLATVTFIATGALTVYIINHLLGGAL